MNPLPPTPVTAVPNRLLEFEFPALRIGCAEYAEGPTGTTVFHFPDRAVGAVDVRGGAPGTYNVDMLRLGYEDRHLDAVVFSGGSWYGLAAASGVAAALKDIGHRSGDWRNLANVAGAIIYDLGARRPTEIHPDAALGKAALLAAQTGRFPLGPCGAGRCTMQGAYFGLNLHSGQGGAFRQIGATRIAAFVVANPVGVITRRDGSLLANGEPLPAGVAHVGDLLGRLPLERDADGMLSGKNWGGRGPNPANTTISLVVTNRRLTFAQVQRLAVQVHASMGRAIQPYSTQWDGDVLFAASTSEVDDPALHVTDLGTIAGEVMWDALESVFTQRPVAALGAGESGSVGGLDGLYTFAPGAALEVQTSGATIRMKVLGDRGLFGVPAGALITAETAADGSFQLVPPETGMLSGGRFFRTAAGEASLVLNPGQWQQTARKADA